MIISLLLAKQIASMLIMVFMGFLLVRLRILKIDDSKAIATLTLYIVGPCVTIDAFQVECSPEKINALGITVAAAILSYIATIPLTRFLRRPLRLDPMEQASAIYSNGGNLIIPIVSYVFGPEWILYTSGFLLVQVTLFWTHCLVLLKPGATFRIRDIFKRINIMAILFGAVLFVTGIRIPEVPRMAIHNVGVMVGPLCMIVTGMLIGSMDLRRLVAYRKLPLIVAMRLIIYPMVTLLIFRLSGLSGMVEHGHTILLISFLAAAAPCASTVTQMSQLFGHNGEYASLINVVTTLLCVFSMPLLVYLFQMIVP